MFTLRVRYNFEDNNIIFPFQALKVNILNLVNGCGQKYSHQTAEGDYVKPVTHLWVGLGLQLVTRVVTTNKWYDVQFAYYLPLYYNIQNYFSLDISIILKSVGCLKYYLLNYGWRYFRSGRVQLLLPGYRLIDDGIFFRWFLFNIKLRFQSCDITWDYWKVLG